MSWIKDFGAAIEAASAAIAVAESEAKDPIVFYRDNDGSKRVGAALHQLQSLRFRLDHLKRG